MTARVLFIDDEKNVLSAFQRTLRSDFDVAVANGGAEALKLLSLESFPVVVCDMRMPGMDGIDTLKEVAAVSPDTVRIMLTGNSDQETASRAINEGRIFRFLTKPCSDDVLRTTLRAALRQHELVTAEKVLLEKTLAGSVRVLMDVLSVTLPEAFGRATRVRHWVTALANEIGIKNSWEVGLAASLAPIGLIGVPPDIIAKATRGSVLSGVEAEVMSHAPETAYRLISNIPRLQNVALIVLNQNRGFDGSGQPVTGPKGEEIPEGARVLKILNDLAAAGDSDVPTGAMVAHLRSNPGAYDPHILGVVRRLWGEGAKSVVHAQRARKEVTIDGLRPGDQLMSDIMLVGGKLLLGAGVEISMVQIERLRTLRRLEKIKEPIQVMRLEAV